MIKLRFSTDVWIALLALGLGCIDVSSIPAPSSEALDWKNPPELSRPRQGVAFDAAAMATLGDQTILFKGESATTWSWDGRTWTQLHPATSPSARSGARMATLRNKVVLFGGSGANAPGDDTWEWNGTTWKQLAPPSRPPARSDHAMATLDDKVVVFGGSGSAGLLDDTWEWDGATWSQVTSGGGPSARTSAAMATLGHKVVLFGGKVPGGDYYNYYSYQFADTWEWDGFGWTERTPGLASDPPAGSNYAMATLGDKLVMSGANDPAGSHLWEWDGTSWTSVGPFCSAGCPGDGPSTGFGAMASRKETVLLVGRGLGSTNETWEWNGERLLPRLVASPTYQLGDSHPATGLVVADRRVAMAAMGDKVVLWGDAVGTWEWDGALWTALAPSTSPPKRSGHAMATLRDKVVLFGGWPAPGFPVGQPLADTWEWDGTTWTRRDPPASPPPRAGHAMATLGNKVVLFGGSDLDGHPLGDTWEWDGTTWTERTSADGPTARYAHAMASLGDRVVLFGGVGVSNETWAWDGATWTQLASTSAPTARSASAMATLKDSVILFGGFEGETPVHDTWALTGGEWTQVLPTTYPPERGDHAMATFAGEVVLVGGSDDRSTWLLGAFPGGGSSGAGTGGTDNVTTGAGGSGAAAGDGGGGGSAPMGKGGTGPGAAGGAAGSAATGRGGSGGGSQGIPLQQDGSGHYDGSNAAGVIGSWWSAGDDYGSDSTAGSGTCRMAGFPAATCSVLSAPTPGLPFQPDPSGRGMCASGTAARVMNDATGAPAYSSIWGDIIGFDLNNPGSLSDGVNLRSQYDAVARGITGFAFDIDSVPAGGHLRIAFETLGTEANLAYWQGASMDLSPISSPGHYEFRWPQVGGPYYLPNAPPFDPTLLESVVFQVVSNTTTPVPFSFCISSVMLLTN